ncbi:MULTISPECIES: hypothetical protein [unclassified Flavobacterium]|uniref:hypothetical protein n=1 Tax=unclassified Flavobacterium TaxID=196869 RepID=UPI00096910A7|nr:MULTISPECIES: hypothetical protein [unclassified Flavobacterium]MBN9285585.1 hypothetical protein [Flavobacterium sp.]OJV71058.1 MAG: hypothetical protein BGO42_04385 [Flavobacterium sp. 40-81]
MGITAKHIVITGALLGIGVLWYSSKLNKWKETMTKLKALPTGIRNFDINFKRLRFNLDVTLYNPTSDNFNPDGVIAVVKRIVLKDKTAKRIATITVNKSFISIPAKGKFELKDLLVEIPILENLSNWQSLSQITGLKDVQTETIIGVLGKEYSIVK